MGIQHGLVTAYGAYWSWLRFGPGYRQALEGLRHREGFAATEWAAWTSMRLREVLRVAAEEVPYYRRNWGRDGVEAARAGQLQDLPLLEKEPIRTDPKSFVRAGERTRRGLVFHTSGSTGTPIAVHWTRREFRTSRAIREVRSLAWAKVSYRLPRATFSGRLVVTDPNSRGPYYRYNAVDRQVYFSAFHLNAETARSYVAALHRHGVKWLTGYAVSFYLLAQYVLELGLEPPQLRAVVTTSEKVSSEMREVMERAFRCRVFEEYSSVESVLFASECEQGRLHVSPDVGVVEILDSHGRPCPPGVAGEVVATCLFRTHQPLVRFRLGDTAAWSAHSCPCGREMPVLEEVVGRIEDIVVGPDGRQMVRFHGIYVGLPGIRCGQVVQEAVDRVVVRVEVAPGYSENVSTEIVRRVRQRLGSDVEVTVEAVDNIPRDGAGKIRAVVSRLER